MRDWENWSGGLRFEPQRIVRPGSIGEVTEAVLCARREGLRVRPVGAGHSSSPLVETPGMLLSLERMAGLVSMDPDARIATLLPGTPLQEAGRLLRHEGFAFENLGDVDSQQLAGAFSTGTHGSGPAFPHVGANLAGAIVVTGDGETLACDEIEVTMLAGMRLGLGALGIFAEMRVRVIPAMDVIRREWCVHADDCLRNFETLVERNRNFDFYWYPRRDEVKIRTHNPVDDDPGMTIPGRELDEERGPLDDVLTSTRTLKFHEMEYFVAAEDGLACFEAVRERMKQVHRKHVAWRVLVRTIAGDDALLSPTGGRPSVSIAVHQNAPLPYREFFADIEPLFRRFGGRPHWAKLHTLGSQELSTMYAGWGEFRALQRKLDPAGLFLNDHLRQVLDED